MIDIPVWIREDDDEWFIHWVGLDWLLEDARTMRQQILDAVAEALGDISIDNGYNTDVAYVSTNLNIKHPEELDKNKLPACFPMDDDETKVPLSLFGITDANDMMSTLTVTVTSIVYDRTGDNDTDRTGLMQDVEKAIVNDAGLLALLIENPTPTTVVTDKGYFGNYSVWDQAFEMKYLYNHEDGG